MKAIITSFIFVLSNLQILPQENLGWKELEIFMMTANLPSGVSIRYKMEAVGTVWHTSNFINYFTTNDYNIAYFPPLTHPPTGNTDWSTPQRVQNTTWGFNFIPVAPFLDFDNYSYGIYKVSSNYSDQYFYLDYRDDRYPLPIPPYVSAPGGNDFWVLYNKTNNRFYSSQVGLTTWSDSNWIIINKGDYLSIWQIKGVGAPTTSRFPNFWQNCLSLVDNGSSCPRLIWGAYPNNNVTVLNYKVYRSITNDVLPPPPPNYILLSTKSSTVLTHEDTDFTFSGPLVLRYKVTAVVKDASNNVFETDATNVVFTSAGLYKGTGKEIKELSTRILNNYPNPFNPATTVKYKLNEGGNVKLVVTNSLGEEVKMFEEGFKEAGEYSVTFKSDNLPSGIYICSLITKNGIISNKMLLLR